MIKQKLSERAYLIAKGMKCNRCRRRRGRVSYELVKRSRLKGGVKAVCHCAILKLQSAGDWRKMEKV